MNKGIIQGDNFNITHLEERASFYQKLVSASRTQLQKFETLARLDKNIDENKEIMLKIERRGLELKQQELDQVRKAIKAHHNKLADRKTKVAKEIREKAQKEAKKKKLTQINKVLPKVDETKTSESNPDYKEHSEIDEDVARKEIEKFIKKANSDAKKEAKKLEKEAKKKADKDDDNLTKEEKEKILGEKKMDLLKILNQNKIRNK